MMEEKNSMAIKKNDILLLLTELQDNGVDVSEHIQKVMKSSIIPSETLKFINDKRPLEINKFYTHIRKNYNNNRSDLYMNIMKENIEPQEVLTTLSALLTQILLWSRKVDSKPQFLSHSRSKEISLVLYNYFKEYDINQAMKLLLLVKADIKLLESIK